MSVGGDKPGRQTKKVERCVWCVCVCGGGSLSGTDIITQPVIYLTVASLGLLRLSMTLLYLTADRNGNKLISYMQLDTSGSCQQHQTDFSDQLAHNLLFLLNSDSSTQNTSTVVVNK